MTPEAILINTHGDPTGQDVLHLSGRGEVRRYVTQTSRSLDRWSDDVQFLPRLRASGRIRVNAPSSLMVGRHVRIHS